MPTYSLQTLAELVNGRIVGNKDVLIHDALPLVDAMTGCITLVDSSKQTQRLLKCPALAVVTNEPLADCPMPQLVVSDIHAAFTRIILAFRPDSATTTCRSPAAPIAETARVDASAQIGKDSTIGHHSVIGPECRIGQRSIIHSGVTMMERCCVGDDCEILPGTVLYAGTQVGSRVVIHANVVVGAFGFGYRPIDGRHVRAAQLGWVEIGDDVEIGAGSTIDRGTYGATKIGCGTKFDNQVQIGHNCHIGRHNLICSQVGIAGSSTTGDYVVMGGQVGLADHLHIGDRAQIGAKSGLMSDVEPDAVLLGVPAAPIKHQLGIWACQSKLPEWRKELRSLANRIAELESRPVNDPQRDAA